MRKAVLVLCIAGAVCCGRPVNQVWFFPEQLQSVSWPEIEVLARGSEVAFGMWAGDDVRNRYLQEKLAPLLERRFGVRLRIVPCNDTAELVSKLLNEQAAGKTSGGSIDMIWINGENFRTAKAAGILWGPFASHLPNIGFYPPGVGNRDFGEPVEGFEAPWQKSQFVMGYDPARTSDPPRSIGALAKWVRLHPARFTYPAPPDFTGSAFLRHIFYHFGGGPEPYRQGFHEELYRETARKTFEFLRAIKPFLWREGETYPMTPKQQDRLFANREIDLAMSYNPDFVSRRIERGEYPATARTYVFEGGTIGNYNFLAIPFNASNVPGALTVINYLLSPESALSMSRALRIPFPLNLERLEEKERTAAEKLPRGMATLPDAELAAALLPEPDSHYLDRLEQDWLAQVLRP